MQKRTLTQNSAIHKLYEMIASELNESGLDMRKTLKPEVEIMWTKESVKEYLWRPIQKIMFQKKSTKDLTGKEIDLIFEVISKHLAEKHGLEIIFPSIDSLRLKELTK